MPVVIATSDTLPIACLLFPHEWSAALSLTHRLPGTVDVGQSGREGRRPEGETLRFAAALQLVLAGEDAQAFRQTLATLAGGWVGIPLWHDQFTGADPSDSIYAAGRLFDFTAEEIVAADSVLDDGHVYAPLLVGHIDELPELPAVDRRLVAGVRFTLTEDSPPVFAVAINATVAAGTFPAALAPDWSDGTTQTPTHGLTFRQIGQGRERAMDGQEMAFKWGEAAPFTLAGRDAIRTLLAFFVASEGLRKKFTAPLWFAPGTPTAEAPATTKCRFAGDALTLDYVSGHLATGNLTLVQVPWEIVGVEGEEPEQPPRVFLYKFTYRLPTPQISRYTNWERALARDADGTYAPAPMQHRSLLDKLDLRGVKVVVESVRFPGNPLQLWQPDQIEAPLNLEIYECESWPVDPDTAVLWFVGEVKQPAYDGRDIEAPVVYLAGILERELPGVNVGPNCNTWFCSPRCGLTLADYLESGTFTAVDGCVVDIATAADDAANTFVRGKIAFGAGAAWEQRSILASEPIVGGQRFTVDWPVRQAPAGQVVSFHRSCTRTGPSCRTFGAAGSWKARFRGHEHIPETNLSFPTVATADTGGKK